MRNSGTFNESFWNPHGIFNLQRICSLAKRILFRVREAFKNKNDETYGIFHMLVDPPPYQHMENSFVIFFCLKMTFIFPPKKV